MGSIQPHRDGPSVSTSFTRALVDEGVAVVVASSGGQPASIANERPSHARYWLVGLFALAALLRLYGITAECLWLDEGFTLQKVSLPFGEMLAATARDVHMPLHDIVLWPFFQLFGESEWVLRLPSLVFSLLTLALAGRIALEMFGEQARLITVAILALSPLHIIYAQEGRPYALFGFLAAWSMFRLVLFLRSPDRRNAIFWCAVTLLLMYSHYYAVFIVAAANAFVITQRLWSRVPTVSLRMWFAMQAVVALCVLPWVPFVLDSVQGVQGAFWIPRPNLEMFVKLAAYYGGYAFPLVALLVLYAWVARRRVADLVSRQPLALPPGAPLALLSWWMLLPIAVPVLLSFVTQPLFHQRFTIASSTAVYILMGAAIAAIGGSLRRRQVQIVVVFVLLSLHIPALVWLWRFERKPEWRDLVALLEQRGPSDQLVLAPDEERWAFMYHAREAELGLTPTRLRDVAPIAPHQVPPATSTIWVARNRFDQRPGDERAIAERVLPGRRLAFEVLYPRLHIQRWELDGAPPPPGAPP